MHTIAAPAPAAVPATASNRATANTPPRLQDFDVIGGDTAIVEALHAFGAGDRVAECSELGRALGSAEGLEAGFLANEQPPVHRPYDRGGARTDEVTFTPAWDHVMRLAVEHGVAGAVWADPHPAAQVARAAKFIGVAQVEAGSTCPLAMTYACVPALRLSDEVAARWEGPVTAGVYDPSAAPVGEKAGALIGMALTEKQGGSDVRANTTVAEPDGADGWYRVTGEKWFVSAVHSDGMFVLAQAPEGISCLLVPRRLDDRSANGWTIDRLKSKLGNRSNPTAEVRFDASRAQMVGEPGRGVRAIMAMIGGTRQDCVLGSTAVMRTGTIEAIHWARHRGAFGRPLAEQPAMTAVLADLALESEAATWSALRLARATQDAIAGDARAMAFRRLAGPVLKFWVCKRAPMHAGEAQCRPRRRLALEREVGEDGGHRGLLGERPAEGAAVAGPVDRLDRPRPHDGGGAEDAVLPGAADHRHDRPHAAAGLPDHLGERPVEPHLGRRIGAVAELVLQAVDRPVVA
ncbi:MAG: acyl-CoA dehydrogenase family protein [Solirubrobacterales bacterium]|nr:acyl-CoA dehydrogenase family protein [Solirubrobacterales bacterium]